MTIEEAKKYLAKQCYEESQRIYDYIQKEGPEDEDDMCFDEDGQPSIKYIAGCHWDYWNELREEHFENDPGSEMEKACKAYKKDSDAADAFYEGFYQFVRDKYGRESDIIINVHR